MKQRWIGQGFIFGRARRIMVSHDPEAGDTIVYLIAGEDPSLEEIHAMVEAGQLTPYTDAAASETPPLRLVTSG